MSPLGKYQVTLVVSLYEHNFVPAFEVEFEVDIKTDCPKQTIVPPLIMDMIIPIDVTVPLNETSSVDQIVP